MPRPLLAMLAVCAVLLGFPAIGAAQAADGPAPAEAAAPRDDRRILGVIPNYKTVSGPSETIEPLTVRQKFTIARRDTFDPPIFLVAGVYSALGQAENQYPSWGQGARGFAHRYAIWYADLTIGNFMTEAIFPSLLHEDPRYFRRGEGSTWKRAGYALTRVLVTRSDHRTFRFNTSEILGNAVTAGVGLAYLPPANRTVEDFAGRWVFQVGSDSLSNILKEFWPDLKSRLVRKRSTT